MAGDAEVARPAGDGEVVPAAGDAEVVPAAGEADTAAPVFVFAAGEVEVALDAGEVLPAAGDAPDAIAGLCIATPRSSHTLCRATATTGKESGPEICHVRSRPFFCAHLSMLSPPRQVWS